MHVVDVVIFVGWAAFGIYWIAASAGAKPGQTRLAGFVSLRIGLILLVFVLLHVRAFKQHADMADPWLQGIGLAFFVLGLALAIWARVYLGRNWGMPMSQKDDPELVTTGPYGSVRHPIYTGLIVAMIGTAIAVSWYWLVVVIVTGGFFLYSAAVEERNMARLFPGSYPQYKRSTKMLIPFIL